MGVNTGACDPCYELVCTGVNRTILEFSIAFRFEYSVISRSPVSFLTEQFSGYLQLTLPLTAFVSCGEGVGGREEPLPLSR